MSFHFVILATALFFTSACSRFADSGLTSEVQVQGTQPDQPTKAVQASQTNQTNQTNQTSQTVNQAPNQGTSSQATPQTSSSAAPPTSSSGASSSSSSSAPPSVPTDPYATLTPIVIPVTKKLFGSYQFNSTASGWTSVTVAKTGVQEYQLDSSGRISGVTASSKVTRIPVCQAGYSGPACETAVDTYIGSNVISWSSGVITSLTTKSSLVSVLVNDVTSSLNSSTTVGVTYDSNKRVSRIDTSGISTFSGGASPYQSSSSVVYRYLNGLQNFAIDKYTSGVLSSTEEWDITQRKYTRYNNCPALKTGVCSAAGKLDYAVTTTYAFMVMDPRVNLLSSLYGYFPNQTYELGIYTVAGGRVSNLSGLAVGVFSAGPVGALSETGPNGYTAVSAMEPNLKEKDYSCVLKDAHSLTCSKSVPVYTNVCVGSACLTKLSSYTTVSTTFSLVRYEFGDFAGYAVVNLKSNDPRQIVPQTNASYRALSWFFDSLNMTLLGGFAGPDYSAQEVYDASGFYPAQEKLTLSNSGAVLGSQTTGYAYK